MLVVRRMIAPIYIVDVSVGFTLKYSKGPLRYDVYVADIVFYTSCEIDAFDETRDGKLYLKYWSTLIARATS